MSIAPESLSTEHSPSAEESRPRRPISASCLSGSADLIPGSGGRIAGRRAARGHRAELLAGRRCGRDAVPRRDCRARSACRRRPGALGELPQRSLRAGSRTGGARVRRRDLRAAARRRGAARGDRGCGTRRHTVRVVAEASRIPMVATRRLQLVAAEADMPVLLLRRRRGRDQDPFCRAVGGLDTLADRQRAVGAARASRAWGGRAGRSSLPDSAAANLSP